MTRPRAWLDTETTGLHRQRRAYEIAAIARPDDGTLVNDVEFTCFVDIVDLDMANAAPEALSIGRFWQRHPQAHLVPLVGTLTGVKPDLPPVPPAGVVLREWEALDALADLTKGAVVHGSNPSFDVETLAPRMVACRLEPGWHYHPEDVPSVARGWLLGRGHRDVPRKSDVVSALCGIDPAGYDRHTALGDCRWVRDLSDRIEQPAPALVDAEAQRAAVRAVFERANEHFGGDTVEELDAVLDGALAEYADKAAGSFRREREAMVTGNPTPNVQHVVLAHLLTVTSALREVLGYGGTPVCTEIVDAMRAERAAAGSPS